MHHRKCDTAGDLLFNREYTMKYIPFYALTRRSAVDAENLTEFVFFTSFDNCPFTTKRCLIDWCVESLKEANAHRKTRYKPFFFLAA